MADSRESRVDVNTELAGKITETFRPDSGQFVALFSNMLDAYIYCKIVVNNERKPVDWVFIDVNDAYARLTALKKDQIVGKKISAFFPDEQKDPWVCCL